jgi:hypothetical protein
MANSFESKEILERDMDDAAALVASVFGGTATACAALLRFWTEMNPAWTPGMARGWLIRSPEGHPAAFTANIPFKYMINGTEGISFATGSTCVGDRWRGKKLSKLNGLSFIEQTHADLLLATGSTDVAYRLWLGLGMLPLHRTWPSSSARILADVSRLAADKLRPPAVIAPLLLRSARLSVRAVRSIDRFSSNIKVRRIDSFDVPGSAELEQLTATIGAETYAIRNRNILNWMYFGCDHVRATRIVLAAFDGEKVVGYIGMKWIRQTLYVVECRCRHSDVDIARSLLRGARDCAEELHAYYVNVWRYSPMLQAAMPRGATIKTSSPPMMTYCYLSNVGSVRSETWDASPGDGDVAVN